MLFSFSKQPGILCIAQNPSLLKLEEDIGENVLR
jgi:hypothetical protein